MAPADEKRPHGGLYSGFESYRVMGRADIEHALSKGVLALDTSVLLSLYRYHEQTVDDVLKVAKAAGPRLFVPHQVVREFWRNRQSVITSLGGTSTEARKALEKNSVSSKDAISRWAKPLALPQDQVDALHEEVDQFYGDLRDKISDEPTRVSAHTPTSDDPLLRKLESLLDGAVGPALNEEAWKSAVEEGERRVENSVPPGYMDIEKLESDLPEGASGDYLVWHQLMIEGARAPSDMVLVTADTKEDWWNRGDRGAVVGPRRELVEEYLDATGMRLFLLEPADLIRHASALGVGANPASVDDIQRVQNEEPTSVPWSKAAAQAVLRELSANDHVQASVIDEAIQNGGRISRDRVYEIDGRSRRQMLRGFTRPVQRITTELQARDVVPFGVPPLLRAVYEAGVKTSHFAVPPEVVALLGTEASSKTDD